VCAEAARADRLPPYQCYAHSRRGRMPPKTSTTLGSQRTGNLPPAACPLAARRAVPFPPPGTSTGARASGLVDHSLSQPTDAVHNPIWALGWPIGSGSVGEWGKHQHTRRRSPSQRRGHAASVGRTSITCWCCAMRSAIESGNRPGRTRERISTRCAPGIGTHRVISV
jgi:hypothetical protein